MPSNSTLNRTEISQNPSDAFDLLLQNTAAQGPDAYVLPQNQIQEIINQLLPQYKKLRYGRFGRQVEDAPRLTHSVRSPASPEGKISDRCCTSLKPVVSLQCLCTRTFATYLYTFLRTPGNDLNPYLPLFRYTFNGLECDALDDLVFYPSDKCAA